MGLRSAFDLMLAKDSPLSQIDQLVWQSLIAGASSKRHPWNEGFFSTVALDAVGNPHPRTRTVILRRADRQSLTIDFHTDFRSSKVSEVENQFVCWMFYSHATKMQLRLEGTARIVDGFEADQAWSGTSIRSRSAYLSTESPGKIVEDALPPDTSDRVASQSESERGRSHFRIVRTLVNRVDWLYLKREGHRRARIVYQDGAAVDCHWVIP
ncbi:MAG: pyridoxamine 5'-phosphate oxidase family protein [Planctomycetota bacterium]